MTDILRTAYPRLKSRYAPKELEEVFTPTPDDLAFVEQATQDGEDRTLRLSCLVQLKCFQHLGYFPALKGVPDSIRGHILEAVGQPEARLGYASLRTRSRHRAAIRHHLGIAAYRQGGEAIARQALRDAAQTMGDPADLINSAIEELVRRSVELPGFTTLDELTQNIRTEVNTGWYQHLIGQLTPQEQSVLLSLPTRRDDHSRTDFTTLKTPPGKPTLSEMKRIKDRLNWLAGLLDTGRLLAGIPSARVTQFAAEARSLESGDIARFSVPHQVMLLTCLLHQATIETRDHLIEMFLKRMRQIHVQAQQDLDLIRQQQRRLTERMVRLMGDVAGEVEVSSDMALLGSQVSERLDGPQGAADIRRTCEALSLYDDDNILPLLIPHYEPYRRTLFEMLTVLDFHSTTRDESVMAAWQFIKLHQREKPHLLPAEVSLQFASRRWRKQVIHEQEGVLWYDQRQLEVCVFSYVAAELRSGDLAVDGSALYADFRQQLLPWTDCQPLLADYCQRLGLPATSKQLVRHLKSWLARAAREVDQAFPHKTQLSLDANGTPTLKRIHARPMPASVKAFQREMHRRMPQRHLLDVTLPQISGHFLRGRKSDTRTPPG